MERELTIVGGGLAGLSLAVALTEKGIPVTVWEAGTFPRHRVCGEFICGVRPKTLENLGVAEDLSDALIHRKAKWYDPQGKTLYEGELPRNALGLSRYALDLRLVEKVEANGGRVRLGERWRGDSMDEGVVLASGRTAERTDWMGFKVHISGDLPRDLTLYLGDGGYVGLSPVEGGYWNLCGLFRKRSNVRAGKEEILGAYASACGMTAVEDLLDRAQVRPESAAGVAGVSFALPEKDCTEMRIGDAWGVIPPFTGNGMSIAFESAECALEPILDWQAGRVDWNTARQKVSSQHNRLFRRRFIVANGLHPWLLRPSRRIWLRSLARLRILPFRSLFALTH